MSDDDIEALAWAVATADDDDARVALEKVKRLRYVVKRLQMSLPDETASLTRDQLVFIIAVARETLRALSSPEKEEKAA